MCLRNFEWEAHVMVSILICEVRNGVTSFIKGDTYAYEMPIVKHKKENWLKKPRISKHVDNLFGSDTMNFWLCTYESMYLICKMCPFKYFFTH